MDSFQAKIGRDRLRVIQKKKKKVIVSIHSNPIWNKEFPKNSKRKAKILKTSLWIHFKPKQHGTGGE